MSVRLYVEGGGDQGDVRTRCRRGFSEFFRKFLTGRMPRVIVSGGRRQAYDDFVTALRTFPDELSLLLVDAEAPVTAATPWQHVAQRAGDGWSRPPGASDDSLHLMVQTMEAWLVTDRVALARFYGQGFRENALPAQRNIEAAAKLDVARRLDEATRDTKTKGRYHKTLHGFELLATIDPALVRAASAHADRLCAYLIQVS